MKRSTACLLMLVLALAPALATGAFAQVRTHEPTDLDLLEGRVVRIDHEQKTFEMRQRGASAVMYTVAWNEKTAFTFRNEASTLDDLQRRIRAVADQQDSVRSDLIDRLAKATDGTR